MNISSALGAAPSRRRISQACDQCHELRTRCNGQLPCSHCVGKCPLVRQLTRDFVACIARSLDAFGGPRHLLTCRLDYGLACDYAREKKKRGKVAGRRGSLSGAAERRPSVRSAGSVAGRTTMVNVETSAAEPSLANTGSESLRSMENVAYAISNGVSYPVAQDDMGIDSPGAHAVHDMLDFSVFNSIGIREATAMHAGLLTEVPAPLQMLQQSPSSQSNSRSTASPSCTMPQAGPNAAPAPANASGSGLLLQSPPEFQTSQPHQRRIDVAAGAATLPVRYPVLLRMARHLQGILSMESAQDLLEFYFSSSWSKRMHPDSPYVLGFVFRKASILHPTSPRTCQKALLASMLWVAAQTSELSILTSAPYARGQLCDSLMKLTLKLLKSSGTPSMSSDNMATPESEGADTERDGRANASWHTCQLDNVATYIHLAVVASASEFKGTSIKWWSLAWELARQLKLGREVPVNLAAPAMRDSSASPPYGDRCGIDYPKQSSMSEEHREEGRRIWWVLYAVDRHLALCYNRPLTLLDAECQDLLQPMNDTDWEAGNFSYQEASNATSAGNRRHRSTLVGPQMTFSGHSIFGYFVPLMTILGDIVDLHHSKAHPRYNGSERAAELWNLAADEIRDNLRLYEESVQQFEQQYKASSMATDGFLEEPPPNDGEIADASAAPQRGYSDNDANGDHLAAKQATIMRSVMNLANNHSADPTAQNKAGYHNGSRDATVLAQIVLDSFSSQTAEDEIQTRIVAAYSRHVLHVLHILLAGRWDPVSLFDGNDPWISSQSFVTTTHHALSAADEIAKILQFDPGLEFMPFFWGIYLLQGSFLPLLIADMLQRQTSPPIVRACETIMQAHQASVVTLRTEYQVRLECNFLIHGYS